MIEVRIKLSRNHSSKCKIDSKVKFRKLMKNSMSLMFLKIQYNTSINLKINNNKSNSKNHLHKKIKMNKMWCKGMLINTHLHRPKPRHNLLTSTLPLNIYATNKARILTVKDKQLLLLTIDYPPKSWEWVEILLDSWEIRWQRILV